MAAVLFLAPADLGETVLATGALAHVLTQSDTLTVTCPPEAACLFRAAPGLAAIHVAPAQAGLAARWALWGALARTRFDLVLDARGGLLGHVAPAARRVALKPAAQVRHRVEDWAEALGAPAPLAPKIWFDAPAREAAAVLDAGPLIVLAPGGAERAKRWAPERFAAVARRLASGPLANARIVVLGAAERDAEILRSIVSSLDADGLAAHAFSTGFDLLAAAALAERATLVLGNDNALTHLAAAAGAPTITLFGPTDERVRGPFGARVRTLRGRALADYAALDADAAMEDVSIDVVEAASLELLHAGGLG